MRPVPAVIVSALLTGLAAPGAIAVQTGQAPPARDLRTGPAAPQGTGAISGQVVDAATAQPLPGVRVNLSGADQPMARGATTDAQGRFEITALPAGKYTLSAMRAGYVESSYGQNRPGSGRPGTAIQLTAGQQIKNLALPLARGGVITGMVVDEFGFPAAGTAVRAFRGTFRNGERTLQPAGTAETDDRGVYRIFGLLPGEYVVVATARRPTDGAAVIEARKVAEFELAARLQTVEKIFAERAAFASLAAGTAGPTEGYAPVYYPGTPTASMATRLALDASEERSGIDFGLQVVPLSRITGTVTGITPLPPALMVYLTETGPVAGLATTSVRVGADGRFSFAGVAPGQYQLIARVALRAAVPVVAFAPGAAGQTPAGRIEAQPSQWMWAQADLTVSGQPESEVVLTLAPGVAVSGTVTFRGSSPAPADPSRVRLSFLPVGSSPSTAEMELASGSARVDAQGRFTAVGMMPGRYRITAAGAPGWTLASVTAQGREALDFPIEIKPGEDVAGLVATFSDRMASLDGMLQDAEGRPTSSYTVVVFAQESQYWTPLSRRIQAVRPSTDGRFLFRGLPPGEYRLAAVVDPEPGEWFDPDFLRQLVAASTPIGIAEGETRTQQIRVQ